MATAAAAPSLPRSKTSVPTKDTTTATSAPATTIVSDESAARNRPPPEPQSADDSEFVHPDHVIPPRDYSRYENLIIVCCHAVYLPNAEDPDFPLKSPYDEKNWLLAPFQKSDPESGKIGEHNTFLAHAKAGVEALTSSQDAHADKNLLIFSGGPTKRFATLTSESRSYYHAALAEELAEGHLGGGRTHRLFMNGRILLEEHATDSFQNLLLSILLFRSTTGFYPRNIRIITHAFKAKRFLELHAPAIRWPQDRIQVQGIDPVLSTKDLQDTLKGEEQFGYASWESDPMGTGKSLSEKRIQRGWNEEILDELSEGLEDSSKDLLNGKVTGKLPWENMESS